MGRNTTIRVGGAAAQPEMAMKKLWVQHVWDPYLATFISYGNEVRNDPAVPSGNVMVTLPTPQTAEGPTLLHAAWVLYSTVDPSGRDPKGHTGRITWFTAFDGAEVLGRSSPPQGDFREVSRENRLEFPNPPSMDGPLNLLLSIERGVLFTEFGAVLSWRDSSG